MIEERFVIVEEVVNLLPDVSQPDFVDAQNTHANDRLMCVYMGALVRSVIALHNLIDNKVSNIPVQFLVSQS